jgi:TetR/AcrR family transcriptional repressor of nem operon
MGRTSDSRKRLMDAAYELIWGYSYGSVTIEAICERAHVKKGSFYYFFDSKSDLAVAAIEAWWVERKALAEELFRPEVPPLQRLKLYLDFSVNRQLKAYEETGQILGCPIFTLGSEICTQDERLRALVHEILSAGANYFEGAVRDAHALGEIEGGNVALKGRLLWAFYEGTMTRARIENNPELLRNLVSDALELIGVRTPQIVLG